MIRKFGKNKSPGVDGPGLLLKLSVDGSFGNRTFEDARRINLKSKAAKAFQTYIVNDFIFRYSSNI